MTEAASKSDGGICISEHCDGHEALQLLEPVHYQLQAPGYEAAIWSREQTKDKDNIQLKDFRDEPQIDCPGQVLHSERRSCPPAGGRWRLQ